MKKSIILSFLFSLLPISCRKEDNPLLPDLTRVPFPLITLDPSSDLLISPVTPNTFHGKFIVDLYFQNDTKPKMLNVVIIKNGDPSTVKTIQDGITTYPTTVDITGAQVAAFFGTAPVEGDTYSIGTDIITESGQKFESFPLVGIGYDASLYGLPGSSPIIQFVVPCKFKKENFDGNYRISQDDWADFAIGDLVTVKPGAGENQISVTAYPSPAFGKNRKPMILDVDPITNNPSIYTVTIAEQVIGDYDGAPPDATIRGTGTVNPCGSKISLVVTINIGGDDYTDLVLVLEK